LAEYLGIGIDDTLAIGDGANDIPMLEQAGVAVVMENADDSIKKLADFVTKNNNESGIATAFEKYVLK
jgi:P-type E1-E2 ATPase